MSYGIAHVAKAMGVQLLDLGISNDCIYQHYLLDAVLEFFSEFCPILKHFMYLITSLFCYKEEWGMFSGAGVTQDSGMVQANVGHKINR